ncbi:tetraprenyl-beta-curcumene synthase family protein [Cytobacillus solani]|uniref:Tetraprenyl-beta-curcumene synthase n=1 Tax=Cytobacillus solani TaxID=1637975 RepID=A0A0Q3QRV1_9BACI|nr:tetraprenyl-beta-curcumene synthase family protein [Cytobacillus solani]KOP83828.1 tetraprenyl-beta-curcumene synthase [Bacillus sp. FJAT-21945]KQL20905.1 tetraprenyl-beta-curcumene synthase [Cytobacillus solani]
MSVPSMPISLMSKVYRRVLPLVHKELNYWKERAEEIPDQELRKQALASIEHKTFHCEGGSIMALMAKEKFPLAIKFIVAYQTISDYLDNLCDRSTSLNAEDFSALHESMMDALTLDAKPKNYYRFRMEQEDGNYLADLAATCRNVLSEVRDYKEIKNYLFELCRYYCDLQIHKHVKVDERVPRLQEWFQQCKGRIPEMEWYEFSACSGSTLGIFCLISYAMRDDFEIGYAENIRNGYFPYIQGLHILLDYFIDQEEDLAGGDLNFCFYYENEEKLFNRLKHFVIEADKHTEQLPHKRFHQLINRGLLGIYLSDKKVRKQKNVKKLARSMIKTGGGISYFFYWNGRVYRAMQNWIPASFKRVLLR